MHPVGETIEGTYSVPDGISLVQNTNSGLYGGSIELSTYSPRILYKASSSSTWMDTEIEGYQGTFANSHAQLSIDNNGNVHYNWFNDENSKFCHTILNDGMSGVINEYTIANNQSGNFFPATIDKVNGRPVFVYSEFFGDSHIIAIDENGQATETELLNIGVPYGRVNLHANNDYISYVTASESNQKIYVTNNQGVSSSTENLKGLCL